VLLSDEIRRTALDRALVSRTQVSSLGWSASTSRSDPVGIGTIGGIEISWPARSRSPSSSSPAHSTVIGSWTSSGICCDQSALPVRHQMTELRRAVFPAPLKPLMSVRSLSNSSTNSSGSWPCGPQCRCSPPRRCTSSRRRFHNGGAPVARRVDRAVWGNSESSACRRLLISPACTCLFRGHRSR
jgi:hypothetical protein